MAAREMVLSSYMAKDLRLDMRKLRRRKKTPTIENYLSRIIIICLVAAIGYVALSGTHAATYTGVAEAESGSVSAGAVTIPDTSASGGKAVVFNGIGTTSTAHVASDSLSGFFAPAFTGTPFCLFSTQNYVLRKDVLTVSYPAGATAPSMGKPYGGMQICLPSSVGPQTSLALTYKVRFPVGFQFAKGGKLPGLYGGVEPFSGGSHNPGGWSMRLMWRTGGAGEVYAYTAKTTGYGDQYGKGNFFWRADEQWHTVTERVTLNTASASNGSVTLAYDGKQVINQTGIDVSDKAVRIGGLFFSTFYGGSDPSWAPTANEHIDFSSFSVSR